jgi:hypothetical protein
VGKSDELDELRAKLDLVRGTLAESIGSGYVKVTLLLTTEQKNWLGIKCFGSEKNTEVVT